MQITKENGVNNAFIPEGEKMRVGTVKVKESVEFQMPEYLKRFLDEAVILKVERKSQGIQFGEVCYLALHPEFAEVEEGGVIPQYDAWIQKGME